MLRGGGGGGGGGGVADGARALPAPGKPWASVSIEIQAAITKSKAP